MQTSSGRPSPLGASHVPNTTHDSNHVSVNVAVHCNLPNLSLVLFPPATTTVTRDATHFIPFSSKTGSVFHIALHGIHIDSAYCLHASSVKGRLLTDPYARWIETPSRDMWMKIEGETYVDERGIKSVKQYLSAFPMLKQLGIKFPFRPARFVPPLSVTNFNWQGDKSPNLPYSNLVIYEAHVRALSQKGTFAEAVKLIPYLKWLGITAVQLMPVCEYVETEGGAIDGEYTAISGMQADQHSERRVGNMWGYMPMSLFSPMNRYADSGVCGAAFELKLFVKELHKVGMECFLDVVYNHSSNASCALHFLNVRNDYYIGQQTEHGFKHSNISGCGNTLAPNKPVMLNLILDSLKWWVEEYHIDGFRLDAAGVLCRDPDGKSVRDPHVIQHICEDPVLKQVKFIVEGWDAGDQIGTPNMLLGKFPRGDRICEWNPEFRDNVRRFFKSSKDGTRSVCKSIIGSPHLFSSGHKGMAQRPLGANHGVNFVACHDGFCLADVVSFSKRVNRDGYDEVSFNCGIEGVCEDGIVISRRARQVRNMIFTLAISRGIPMIHQGDEIGFSKRGHSNPYNDPQLYAARLPERAHDCEKGEHLVKFTRRMFQLRREMDQLRGPDFFEDLVWLSDHGGSYSRRRNDIKEPGSRSGLVAFLITNNNCSDHVYVVMNNRQKEMRVGLPRRKGADLSWSKVIDTSWSRWDEEKTGEQLGMCKYLVVAAQSCILCIGKS